MSVTAVILLVLLAISAAVMVTVTAKARRSPGGPPSVPGVNNRGLINPVSPPAEPAAPGFIILGNPDPGFTIVARSGSQQTPPPKNPGATKPAAATPGGFEFVEVTQNMTAICKLTGKPAGKCTCERHLGNPRRGER
jgi:hypothetical protein